MESTFSPDHLRPIELLAEAFDSFVARTLGTTDEIASNEPGSDPDDASTIESEYSGKTWHNLIYYHFRWDGALLLRWTLTDAAYVEVMPSFLCASLIWPIIEPTRIAGDLLAPIDVGFATDHKTSRFRYVVQHLTPRQRSVVGKFLMYFLATHRTMFENYFSRSSEEIKAAINQDWVVIP
jgi:hypothetical protein